ncbi:2-octaprenyl-6-methoxyphenyl hydroxylase [Thiolinea disciformis]|uniref:2-octaprenyl-6-methoxyphenyl hydroxylase n=1 Tax=Thiolinea disciformis TaxID=125614 RepID=UPI00035E8E20|nr:2-octaprenyl-6-methoxyphenyl hydroxylase [Thiolinea disciformis]
MDTPYDVVIVGGGMVGASLALALSPLGLKFALVETFAFGSQASQPGYDDRSIALSYGSSLIYQGMGLWPALQQGVEPIVTIHVSDRGHLGATRLSASQEQVPALGYVVESRVLGQALHQALTQSSLDLIAPAQVIDLTQEADQVSLHIKRQAASEFITARLVVIADGSRSALREKLGIKVHERDYEQSAVIANVTTEQPHLNQAYERFTPNGPLALLPMTQGRYSLVWTQRKTAADAILALNEADFLQQLQEAFGWRQGKFLRVGQRTAYPLSLIKSEHELAGRAVLIGNASHTLHPVAGQGLNLALRDVALLAELIAEQHKAAKDLGDPILLDTYQSQRNKDYRQVLTYTDTLVRVFSNDFAPLAHARALGLMVVDRIAPLRDLLTKQSMGLRFKKPRLARGLPLS